MRLQIMNARMVSVLSLFLIIAQFTISPGCHAVDDEEKPIKAPAVGGGGVGKLLQPMVKGPTDYRVAVDQLLMGLGGEANSSISISRSRRRQLAPFQLCLVCKCCVAAAADPSGCATMPCCFGIDCQLPNKPFGVCAFVPKTCNCNSCAV